MPLISNFYGILIYLYAELGNHHHKPHIHAKYAEYEMSISIDGKIINGNMPNKQLKIIEAWLEIHKEDILASWYVHIITMVLL